MHKRQYQAVTKHGKLNNCATPPAQNNKLLFKSKTMKSTVPSSASIASSAKMSESASTSPQLSTSAGLLHWLNISLQRQLLVTLSVVLTLASICCLILFMGIYHSQLAQERSSASVAVNRLLQSSLENAMLKRDLDGLRDIIQRLGQQQDIHQVFISNPQGEIRFASNPDLLGHKIETLPQTASSAFHTTQHGDEILRSINPVHNRAPCTPCHGALHDHPINGVLFVDYDATPIRTHAQLTALWFIIAGASIILLTSATLWGFMHYWVVRPVQHLAHTGEALASGNLDARAHLNAHNELGGLAVTFNHMADKLQHKLREVREQKQFLQGLIDAIPDGMRVISPNYQILQVNQAYCQQLGLSSEQALSQPCYHVYQQSEPCAPTLYTCPLHEIQQGKSTVKKLCHYFTAEGEQLPVEVFAAPMHVMLNGEPRQLVVESVRNLAQTIAFSHEQKLSAMGQLAAGVAHEIHNPLSSLRLALHNTLRVLTSGQTDSAQLHNYLQLVDHEVDKCIDVTQRLLKLTTLGDGRSYPIDLNMAVSETLSLLEYERQECDVEITFNAPVATVRVLAQEHDVRMMILNLVQNAFHAMPNGGQLDIDLEQHMGKVQLHFCDNGVGITPEHLSKIFDPFFSYRANGQRGTGLGLSICKALSKQYGGHIYTHSRYGEGSCFTLVLPDADAKYVVSDKSLIEAI